MSGRGGYVGLVFSGVCLFRRWVRAQIGPKRFQVLKDVRNRKDSISVKQERNRTPKNHMCSSQIGWLFLDIKEDLFKKDVCSWIATSYGTLGQLLDRSFCSYWSLGQLLDSWTATGQFIISWMRSF